MVLLQQSRIMSVSPQSTVFNPTVKGLLFFWRQERNSFDEYVVIHVEKAWRDVDDTVLSGNSVDSQKWKGIENILRQWWSDNKDTIPFNAFIGERTEERTLVCLKLRKNNNNSENQIIRLFEDSRIPLIDPPPNRIKSITEWISARSDRTWRIAGRSYKILYDMTPRDNANSWLYVACDEINHKEVVIKILMHNNDQEDVVLASLPPHENVIQLIGHEIIYLRKWLVLEKIEGERATADAFRRYPELIAQLQSVKIFLAQHQVRREDSETNMMFTKEVGSPARLVLLDFGTSF